MHGQIPDLIAGVRRTGRSNVEYSEKFQLTKGEKKLLKELGKVPAQRIRECYVLLLSEVRQKTWAKRRTPVETQLYKVGWQDGYSVGKAVK